MTASVCGAPRAACTPGDSSGLSVVAAQALQAPPRRRLQLTAQQFDALVFGLPWQRLDELSVISRC